MTYGEIAKKLAQIQKVDHMSAQAVGGAVGHNESAIIVVYKRQISVCSVVFRMWNFHQECRMQNH